VPTASDDVILDNSNVTIPSPISLNANESANSLTIGSSNGPALGAFTLQANTGTTSGTLALTSGNITVASQVTGTITLGNSTNGVLTFTTGAAGFTVADNSSQVLNIGGVFNGAGKTLSLDSAGGGMIILGGANTATGAVTVGNFSVGTIVQLNNTNALVSFSNTTVSGGSTVDLDGKAVGATIFTLSGTGVGTGIDAGALVNTTGAASDSGTISLSSAATIKNSGTLTLTGTIKNGGNLLTIDGSGTTVLGTSATTGVISGAGGLAMVGSGTLTLSGDNVFTGGLSVNNGTVVLVSSNAGTVSGAAGPSTSAITLGATGGANSAALASSATVSNGINLGTTTGSLTIGNNGVSSATYSGTINLNGHALTLSDNGAGTTTTYSGGFTGTGTLTISNGATNALTTISTNTVNNSGPIINNGPGTGTTTISANIGSNVTSVTENSFASALTLSGSNAFAGGLFVNQGTVSLSNNSTAAGTGTITLGSSGSANATVAFGGFTFTNNIILASGSTGTLILSSSGTNVTLSGTLNLNGDNLTVASAGTNATGKTVSGTVTGSGNINVVNTGNTYASNGTNGPAYTNFTGTVNNTGTIFNTGNGNGSTTINGSIGSGVQAIVENSVASGVNAPSNLTLSGNDTAFDGNIYLTAGYLSLGSATALGGNGSATGVGGTLTIAANTLLNASSSTTITTVNAEVWNGSFSTLANTGNTLNMGAGTITLANGPMTLTVNGSTFTVGGTITDSASGNNAVFDITKAGAGTFAVGEGIALTANQTVNVLYGNENLTGVVSGGFGLTSNGAGTLTLSGSNTFTGVLTIKGGSTLAVGSMTNGGTAGALGQASNAASNIVIDNGTLVYTGGTSGGTSTNRLFTIGTGGATFTETGGRNVNYNNTGALAYTGSGARTITFGAAGTNSGDNNSIFAPVIADGTGGATSVVKNTAGGRWTVTGTNTYSGGTSIYGGALAVTGTLQSLGTGSVTVYGGGALQLASASNLSGSATILLDGGSNAYATAAFGFDVTDATLQTMINSASTNGVISLMADGGQTTTQSLNMANYGNGTLYLGAGGISSNNNAVTVTYGGTSLGVGAGNVYRIGGGTSPQANTLIINHDVLVNGSGNSLVIGAPGSNNIVNFTTANASFTGATTLNAGTLDLSGSFGALAGSVVTVNNTSANPASIVFDDSTSGVTGTTRTAGLVLNGGTTLAVNGNAGANVHDTITGTLSIGAGSTGQDFVTLTPGSTKNELLTIGNYSRTVGSLVLFRGTSLGVNTIASATANATNIQFTTAPTLTGSGGGVGTTGHGIIVGAFGDTSTGGTGGATGGLVTYDSTNGVRLLQASEYQNGITDGQTALTDVLYTSTSTSGALSTTLTASNTTINSLSLTETGTSQVSQAITITGTAGTTLNVSSGVVYASQSISGATNSAGAQTISVGTLNFGSTEGIFYAGQTNGISNSYFSGGLNILSVITGSAGVTIGGNGYTQFSAANTYTGTTTVDLQSGGRFVINHAAAVPGDLVLNSGVIMETTNGGISSATNFTINGGSYTGQNGNGGNAAYESYASLTMNGGGYSTGSGGHGGGLTLSGSLNMNGGTFTLAQSGNIVVGGVATFSGGVVNISYSSASNTPNAYDDYLRLNGGLVINNTASGLYNPINLSAAPTSYQNGSVIFIDGTTTNGGNVVFNGNSTNSNTVTITSTQGTAGPVAAIALNGVVDFTVNDGAAPIDLNLNATLIEGDNTNISGATQGELQKDGNGTLLLSGGVSTYTDGTVIDAGTLALTGSATLGTTNFASFPGGLTMNGGTLDMGGTSQAVDNLQVNGASTIQNGSLTASDPAAPVYTISNPSGTVNISANLRDSGITGGVPLVMNGTGTLILSGNNTYAGGTTIGGGGIASTLVVANTAGSATGVGAFTLNHGATLMGKGTINSTSNTINGNVVVGSGGTNTTDVLTMTATGTTTITNATLAFNLSSTTAGQSNTLAVGASNAVVFGAGDTLSLNITGTSVVANTTQYELFNSTVGGSGVGGSIYSGITVGANNVISGLTLNIASSQAAGYYSGSYLKLVADGSGYDIDVEVQSVPEPSTYAMLIGGLALLIVFQRSRRQKD
jgi:autotransporter-associated beta strand protein